MKSKLLIAHRWKTLGWILTVPALIAGVIYMTLDSPDQYMVVNVPRWLMNLFWYEKDIFHPDNTGPLPMSILDETISIALLVGLLLLAFSKEKIEDEWIQRVRLESLQWAILINSILLIAFTLFTYGMPFFSVMIYNMFTPLLIFVGRFYYVLYLNPRLSKS